MAYHDWHVGMKIVCIDGKVSTKYAGLFKRLDLRSPAKGETYTIRAIVPIIFKGEPALGLHLKEIDNSHFLPIPNHGGEPAFLIRRFRPVVEREADISVFTAMLNPQDQGVDA